MSFKVIFVDEELEAHHEFMRVIVQHNKSNPDLLLEGVACFPQETIEKMIEYILCELPDAIVTDFQLNDKKTNFSYSVPYNGSDLVESFLKVKNRFPCFITTSYDQDAADDSHDVNLVYVKKHVLNKAAYKDATSLTFTQRVHKQIEHYKKYIQINEARFNELMDKKNKGQLNSSEEQEFLEIDSLLENAIDGRAAIPNFLKEPSNLTKLNELLSSVEGLLNEVKDAK